MLWEASSCHTPSKSAESLSSTRERALACSETPCRSSAAYTLLRVSPASTEVPSPEQFINFLP
jgi:hypothetical protein